MASYEGQQESSQGKGIYSMVVRWALLVGTFLLPIFFLPWTTSVLELNKQLLLVGVAGVGMIAWLLSLVSSGRLSWRSGPFDKGVLAVLGATIVATVFSLSRFNSLFGIPSDLASSLVSVLAMSIIYFLVVNTVEDQGKELFGVLGTSLTLALVYGLLQIFGVHVVRFSFALSHAFNTVGSVDGLGIVAAISLPLLGSSETKGWMRYVNMVGMVAAMAVLVILNWWVLWAVAIAGMVGTIAFGSLHHERFAISRFLFPMTVIVVGVFLIVVNFNIAAVKNNLPLEVAPSFSLSGHVAKSVLKESFVTGYGPETFSMAFDKFGANQLANSTLSSAKFFDATSAAFNAVIQGGLLMVLALLVFAWALFQAIMFHIRNKRTVGPGAQVMWATLVAVGTAFFFYPFNLTMVFLMYMALAGVTLALWGHSRRVFNVEDNVALSLASSLGFIGGLIMVLVGAYFGVSTYLADANYARALAETDINKAATDLVSSVNWNGQSDAYYRAASQVAIGLLSQELNKKADKNDTQRPARIQNFMGSAINLAKTATDLAPRESLNWDNLGNVYQNLLGLVDGVDKLSETSYLKAADLRPGDASFYNKIGNLYLTKANLYQQLAQGNPTAQVTEQVNAALASAESNYKKAVDLSSNFGLAIYNLGVVYDQQGKLPEAIKQLEKIAPFNSDQPNLLFELGLLYYRNGDKDKAFATLQNVLVLQPDFANAHWYLSLIYEERNNIPSAIDELNKILSVDANKDNATVLAKLDQLKSGKKVIPPQKVIDQKPL